MTFVGPAMEGGQVKPSYPESVRADGVQGDVQVRVTIGADGRVSEVKVLAPSPHAQLNIAAEQAAWRQRFTPALLRGEPVAHSISYTYRFRLAGLTGRDPDGEVAPLCPWQPWLDLDVSAQSECAPPPAAVEVDGDARPMSLKVYVREEGGRALLALTWGGDSVARVVVSVPQSGLLWGEEARVYRMGGGFETAIEPQEARLRGAQAEVVEGWVVGRVVGEALEGGVWLRLRSQAVGEAVVSGAFTVPYTAAEELASENAQKD